ncbi:MAG: glycosyltransferase, partial [Sphingomonas bacterium]|nr:glycosyltransferase [Sphingomonas bacterium]
LHFAIFPTACCAARVVVAIAGGGGDGTPATPITLGAREDSDAIWLTLGKVAHEWHATAPGNLRHLGWVDDPATHIAAADLVISSAGNTTVHMVATAGRPWIVVPEWRYFDEQLCKARALEKAGAAVTLNHWPSHAAAWRDAFDRADRLDVAAQRCLVDPGAARSTADWLAALGDRAWATKTPLSISTERAA